MCRLGLHSQIGEELQIKLNVLVNAQKYFLADLETDKKWCTRKISFHQFIWKVVVTLGYQIKMSKHSWISVVGVWVASNVLSSKWWEQWPILIRAAIISMSFATVKCSHPLNKTWISLNAQFQIINWLFVVIIALKACGIVHKTGTRGDCQGPLRPSYLCSLWVDNILHTSYGSYESHLSSHVW